MPVQSEKEKKYLSKIKKLQKNVENKRETKVWVPKAIAVASMYYYYDYFDIIL